MSKKKSSGKPRTSAGAKMYTRIGGVIERLKGMSAKIATWRSDDAIVQKQIKTLCSNIDGPVNVLVKQWNEMESNGLNRFSPKGGKTATTFAVGDKVRMKEKKQQLAKHQLMHSSERQGIFEVIRCDEKIRMLFVKSNAGAHVYLSWADVEMVESPSLTVAKAS